MHTRVVGGNQRIGPPGALQHPLGTAVAVSRAYAFGRGPATIAGGCWGGALCIARAMIDMLADRAA